MDDLCDNLNALKTTADEFPILSNRNPLYRSSLPSMSTCPMATDGSNYLLIYHHQTLMLFHLPQFELLFSCSTVSSLQSPISDLCYDSILNCFLLSSSNRIYSFGSDQQLRLFQEYSNSIWSFTQTSNNLFICFLFGYSIEQWKINSNDQQLIHSWSKDILIDSMDLGINCIRCVNEYLGMTIKERDFSWRIDVFNHSTMHRIRRGRSIQQDHHLSNWIGILSPIDHLHWLFADGDQGLILIDQSNPSEETQQHILSFACNISLIRQINSSMIMDGNGNQRREAGSSSLMELLKRYSERVNERETLVKESSHLSRTPIRTHVDETHKDPSMKYPVHTLPSDTEKINYKAKWEESESKYRLLEKKYLQLESQTLRPMQDKIEQLQRESNQFKIIKQRLAEIDSCRQLTHEQFEQLKYMVNTNDSDVLPIEIIATKNDFLQQTRKLREILVKHQDEFLTKIDQLITKKRKRPDDDLTDDEPND